MKPTVWALTMFTLVLFCNEQARAADISTAIITQEGKYYSDLIPSLWAHYIYPGDYTIKLLVGNDTLGCTVRVGTNSSNPNMLNISGPLAVRNVTDPVEFFAEIGWNLVRLRDITPFRFKCGTAGTIRVANPPTVAVPVMVTFTYGPFLKKTHHLVVTQKVGIKSAVASPVRSYYSLNQRVSMTLTPTRKTASREADPTVYFSVREGKLCEVTSRADYNYGITYTVSDRWRYFGSGRDFFEEGKPLTQFANLCHRGRTIVEFGFPDEKMWSQELMMTDSRILRLEFKVPTGTTTKKSRILSRGLDTQPPPLVIPDPIPPALPNFELQGEKP